MQFTSTFPSKQKVEIEVEIHPQEVECSPETKESAADTEAIQMLQAQPEDDSKKASESQEITDSITIIGHKEAEIAKTKEGIINLIRNALDTCLVALGCLIPISNGEGDKKLRFKIDNVCV